MFSVKVSRIPDRQLSFRLLAFPQGRYVGLRWGLPRAEAFLGTSLISQTIKEQFMNQSQKSVAETLEAIQKMDLDPIKVKLMDAEEGQGWSREYTDKMELAYRRFLTLLVKYPDETIAPTKDVDKFWHGHILDTMKYAEDCQNVFGYFLHHFPYFGMRGEEDAANLTIAGKKMHEIYVHEFGESIPCRNELENGSVNMNSTSAWCYAAKPAVKAGVAWCYAAKPAMNAESAWCYAAKPTVKADAAWCYAASPASEKMQLMNRPGFQSMGSR
ncbi:MAG: glycine-rich domain-containing protein [Burkholderiales bacterium]